MWRSQFNITKVFRDLAQFVQFNKREKRWRSVTFSRVSGYKHSSMGVFHVFQIVKMVSNRAKHHTFVPRNCIFVVIRQLHQKIPHHRFFSLNFANFFRTPLSAIIPAGFHRRDQFILTTTVAPFRQVIHVL